MTSSIKYEQIDHIDNIDIYLNKSTMNDINFDTVHVDVTDSNTIVCYDSTKDWKEKDSWEIPNDSVVSIFTKDGLLHICLFLKTENKEGNVNIPREIDIGVSFPLHIVDHIKFGKGVL